MSNSTKIKFLVALVVIVGVVLFVTSGGKKLGTISSSDVTATRFTQLLVDNGIIVTANGINATGGISADNATLTGLFTQGGGTDTMATTSTTYTEPAADLIASNIFDVTPNGASLTYTLAASSTLTSFIPTSGQVRTIYIRNATTTAGVNITVAGGTGVALKSASTTAIIIGNTAGNSYGKIDFVRKANTDISALITLFN